IFPHSGTQTKGWFLTHVISLFFLQHPGHATATVTSAFLENEYQADKNGVIFFRAGSQQYQLDFAGEVSPCFNLISFHSAAGLKVFTLCLHLFEQLFFLLTDSQEYIKIKRLFEKTMKGYCIHQLQRIQNPTLWDIFQWFLHKSKGVNERLLFHGTSPSHVSAICEQNFDWRLCGTHGTMYGKGTRSYFARDASYSHEYCSSLGGCYRVFVAQVLAGDFVRGSPEYCRPPPRDKNSNRLYDSCVDDPTDPSIFVIFEKQQVYPAYILEYSLESSCVVL
uniref:Poly [ADP-ribose] polymerase n=1 Tax=Zonotrichia albicollis TaxID=44394 RepID=A0A8D2M1J8_ZONAL